MSEERTDQIRLGGHVGELGLDAIFQAFAGTQWPAGIARTLGVAPDQLVGIQFGGIAGQEVQRQFALQPGHIRLDGAGLVRGQVVED